MSSTFLEAIIFVDRIMEHFPSVQAGETIWFDWMK